MKRKVIWWKVVVWPILHVLWAIAAFVIMAIGIVPLLLWWLGSMFWDDFGDHIMRFCTRETPT